eukprot:5122983-Karenia_brevis.AAC.1
MAETQLPLQVRGLGSDQRFPGIPKWHSRMEYLFATINTTKCLPITSVINMGIHVPKKYIATVDEEAFVDTMRSIHVYSAFVQAFGKAA